MKVAFLLFAFASIVRGGQAADGTVTRYRDAALQAFREVDPDAAQVYVVSRDTAGYPALLQSEDGTLVEATALWPRIVKSLIKGACKAAGAALPPPQPSGGDPTTTTTTTGHSDAILILATLVALGVGALAGYGIRSCRDVEAVAGATAQGGCAGGCCQLVSMILKREAATTTPPFSPHDVELGVTAAMREEKEVEARVATNPFL